MLQTGKTIQGTYKIEKLIGSGGSGRVYACNSVQNPEKRLVESKGTSNHTKTKTKTKTGERYQWAIKEAYEEEKFATEESTEKTVSMHSLSVEALRLEVTLLKELKHPSLVKIVDVLQEDGKLLMVMEYVSGRTLSEVLREGGALSEEKVVDIGLQIADVLGYLHSRGQAVVYRDLKPSNLILRDDGRIVLVDFGAVFMVSEDFPIMHNAFGTRGYAAPEQYSQESVPDARMDVYAFGRTLTALLTGGTPGISKSSKISPALLRILKKCTRKNKDKRYANISEVYNDLKHIGEKSLRYRICMTAKLTLFTSMLIPALVFAIDRLTGTHRSLIPAAVFVGITICLFRLFDIPDLLLTLTGAKNARRIKDRKKSAVINGTFQIDEHSGTCQAISWDDIEIPLDDEFMDLRIDLDSGQVQFISMNSFALEQDEVLTRHENYRAVL